MTWYQRRPTRVQAVRIVSIDGNEASFDMGNDEAMWIVEALDKRVGEVGGIWALNDGLRIGTLEGTMRAEAGDYVIKGVKGELYCVKPDVFVEIYDRVDGP